MHTQIEQAVTQIEGYYSLSKNFSSQQISV